jgi:hypothetical protein
VPKKAAVYTMNNPIGMALMESLYKGCKDLGIEIVIDEKYNLPLTTADTMITKAKQMKADLLCKQDVSLTGHDPPCVQGARLLSEGDCARDRERYRNGPRSWKGWNSIFLGPAGITNSSIRATIRSSRRRKEI